MSKISTRHFTMGPEERNHIAARIKGLRDTFKRITSTTVVINREHHAFSAEIIIHGNRVDIEAVGEAGEPSMAFEIALTKVDKQLYRHYGKLKQHRHLPIREVEHLLMPELEESA